jgi:major type 1 subunit fimbrin (pilin)
MKIYMKTQFIRSIAALAVGAALVGMAGQASASDGTITFTGSVDASTCTINTTGTAGSFTVTLPKVSAKVLGAAAETAGDTAFSIQLTGCSDTVGNISTNFEAGSAVDVATGRLNNTAITTPATSVQLQLLNANGSPIIVGAPVASQNSLGVALASDGAPTPAGVGTLNYVARYYATGAATAGAVASQVTYSLVLP